MGTVKALSLDLRGWLANDRKTLNVFENRTGFIEEKAFVDQKNFVMANNTTFTLDELLDTKVFVIACDKPINISTVVGSNLEATLFENQKLLVISNQVGDVLITNNTGEDVEIKTIRFAVQQVIEPVDLLPRQQIVFSRIQRIAALPQPIVILSNVRVQSITLYDWVNDQVTAPGTGLNVKNKFRICNADGTPNPTGSYIMILDDSISQQNLSGTLAIWVEEISNV